MEKKSRIYLTQTHIELLLLLLQKKKTKLNLLNEIVYTEIEQRHTQHFISLKKISPDLIDKTPFY